MKIHNRTDKKHFIREGTVIFAAFVWVVAMGWLFQFSPVAEPALPPPDVARFLAEVRMFCLPGWLLSLLPLWCLWLDYRTLGQLPALKGWLRRYGLPVAASLGTAGWIFSQRAYPDVVAESGCFSYLLLWLIFCVLCLLRRSPE